MSIKGAARYHEFYNEFVEDAVCCDAGTNPDNAGGDHDLTEACAKETTVTLNCEDDPDNCVCEAAIDTKTTAGLTHETIIEMWVAFSNSTRRGVADASFKSIPSSFL